MPGRQYGMPGPAVTVGGRRLQARRSRLLVQGFDHPSEAVAQAAKTAAADDDGGAPGSLQSGAQRTGRQAITSSPADYSCCAELRYCCPSRRRKRANQRGRWSHRISIRAITARHRGAWPDIARIIMRISARNQIKGTVVEVKKGATTSHVRVDIGNGQIVTSSITNESVDELGIKAG